MYLKIDKFQGPECVCPNASLSLRSHLGVSCTDAVPVAEGRVAGCAAWAQLPAHHQAAESSPLQAAFSPECCPPADLGGSWAREEGEHCLLGGGMGQSPQWLCRLRTGLRCELGVPVALSAAAATPSPSPGVVCVKERELEADLLCHPDFGFCHCEFLFSFWKLLFSSILGSPKGIETHRRAPPKPPPPHRSCSGSGEVGLGISDHKRGQIYFQHALFFS